MWIKSLFGAAVASLCALATAVAQPAQQPASPPTIASPFSAIAALPIPSDPALRTGVLPNGVRYALIRPANAGGAVSIRLGIDVGSYEEAEAERGFAHFVEHMAFRSTRNFPNNTVDAAFAAEGLTFGRDHNATTDLFATSYMIDLNRPDPAGVARAFTWLRDVADGVVFEAQAVDRERGVVLAEKQERDGVSQASREALNRFRAPGLRVADRAPIGLDPVLRGATPAALEAFYRRWYRPENAVVVVASDLSPDALVAQIEATFGAWRATGPRPQRAAYGTPDVARGLDVLTRADGSWLSSVDVCRVRPADPAAPEDFAHARRDSLSMVWQEILNQRLVQRRQAQDSQMLGAEVDDWTDGRNLAMACLSIKPTNEAWTPALAAGQAELRRFEAQGPTELEVERAIESVRARFRGAVGEALNRSAPTLADGVLEALLEGDPFVEPRQVLRAYDLAVEDITAADVHAAFKAEWAGAGPLVSVMAPKVPDAGQVRTAWAAQAAAADLTAYADAETATWAYGDAPAGVVASRETVASGGFTRIRFRNGVVLNFKRTRFSQSKAVFMVRFGQGRRQIAARDMLVASLGAPTLAFGGLGRHGYDDITRIMQIEIRDLAPSLAPDSFVIGADEPVANLANKMKVTAAFLRDPAFSPAMNPVLHEGVELTYRITDTTPALKASAALSEAVSPNGPGVLPPKAELQGVDNVRVAQVLRAALTTGPIDVSLVGDVDEKTAIELVAQSFGALPPRGPAAEARDDAFFMRYPARSPPPIRAHHTGPADKAAGSLVWPLYVATPERRREEYAISLLASIFSNELRHQLRGELGKTYAPSVDSMMPDHADQGVLVAGFESYPGDLETLMDEARKVARRLAEGQITQDQLTTAREAQLVTNRQDMATNARWAAALSRSAVNDQDLRDVLGFEAMVGAIRLDEVRKAAADWLTRDPIVVTATSASAPSASAPSASAPSASAPLAGDTTPPGGAP